MTKKVIQFLADEQGQGMTEYAIVIAVLTVPIIAILTIFSKEIEQMFTDIVIIIGGTVDQT